MVIYLDSCTLEKGKHPSILRIIGPRVQVDIVKAMSFPPTIIRTRKELGDKWSPV